MKIVVRYRDIILLTIGTILIILSLCLVFYDKYVLIKDSIFNEVELLKYREKNGVDVSSETINNNENKISDEINNKTNNVETSNVVEDNVTEIPKEEQNKIEKEFIGYLEIKKINLKQGLVSKKSYYNNVNRNIQILNASDYPDKEKGNVILAAHSGTSAISYFKHLYKLVVNDTAKIYYKNYIYEYKIVKIYNVPKTGSVQIIRDIDKTTLTLITCTHDSKTEQTVYILELVSKVKDGG